MIKNKKPQKRLFKLTDTELIKLTQAMHNPSLLSPDGKPLIPAHERCYTVWQEICESRNLDISSVQPPKDGNPNYFLAKEKENDTSNLH